MSRFEAVQCKLGEEDTYILWPGSAEKPPKLIRCEDIYMDNPRTFDNPNPNAPIFGYEYRAALHAWILITGE